MPEALLFYLVLLLVKIFQIYCNTYGKILYYTYDGVKRGGNVNEREIVKKAKSGDKDAFCTLYGIYKDKLYRYAFYRLGSREDALDAVSDTIICAYEQIKNLRNADAFPAWIFKIHRITCLSYIKQQIRQRENSVLEDFSNSTSVAYEFDCVVTELEYALAQLKDDEREVVLLSVVAGFNSNEIAKVTDLTSGSVRSKL